MKTTVLISLLTGVFGSVAVALVTTIRRLIIEDRRISDFGDELQRDLQKFLEGGGRNE